MKKILIEVDNPEGFDIVSIASGISLQTPMGSLIYFDSKSMRMIQECETPHE